MSGRPQKRSHPWRRKRVRTRAEIERGEWEYRVGKNSAGGPSV